MNIFEQKAEQLTTELQVTTAELNQNKRLMVTFNQSNTEKDEKIEILRKEATEYKAKSDNLELQLGTLTITHEKVTQSLAQTKQDYDDTVEKLH